MQIFNVILLLSLVVVGRVNISSKNRRTELLLHSAWQIFTFYYVRYACIVTVKMKYLQESRYVLCPFTDLCLSRQRICWTNSFARTKQLRLVSGLCCDWRILSKSSRIHNKAEQTTFYCGDTRRSDPTRVVHPSCTIDSVGRNKKLNKIRKSISLPPSNCNVIIAAVFCILYFNSYRSSFHSIAVAHHCFTFAASVSMRDQLFRSSVDLSSCSFLGYLLLAIYARFETGCCYDIFLQQKSLNFNDDDNNIQMWIVDWLVPSPRMMLAIDY